MKKIYAIFFLFLGFQMYGQDTIVSYLDRTKKIKVSKDKAYFTRVSFKTNLNWTAILYNLKGELVSEESFSGSDLRKKNGEQKYFHPNQNLSLLKTYNQKEKLDGRFIGFYDNGNKNIRGIYKNDKREGVWNFYYKNGNRKARLIYEKDKIVKYNLWYENGAVKNEKLILERLPKFKGITGKKSFPKYITRKMLSEFKCKKLLKGRIIIMFSINELGKAEQIKIRPNSLPERCNKSIFKIFERMPNWEPGVQLNNKVKVNYTIPIKLN